MKKTALSVLLLTAMVAASAASAPNTLRMDINHSNIGFAVPIMGGLSEVHGKFSKFDLDLKYDRDDVARSSVTARIMTESIDTGIDQRDEHLRTADFFDAERFPEIIFASNKIIKQGKGFLLYGDLTMHGVTKSVKIQFIVTGVNVDKAAGTFVTGFRGELTLNRRDYGINYSHQSVAGFIGDDVRVTLNLLSRANKMIPVENG